MFLIRKHILSRGYFRERQLASVLDNLNGLDLGWPWLSGEYFEWAYKREVYILDRYTT
jgi:hypothetical protein